MKAIAALSAFYVALSAQTAVAQKSSDDDEKRPETAIELARELGVSNDDQRPENQRRLSVFGRPLIIGGEIGGSVQGRKGYELVRSADDDDLKIGPEIKLEAILDLGANTVAFTSAKAFLDQTIYKQGGGASGEAGVQLDEAWILQTKMFGTPIAMQIGRQQVKERREWWWDENLDAVRFHYFGKTVTGYVGAARELGYYSTLGRLDPEDRKIHRIFGHVNWDWSDRQELGVFALHQKDRSSRPAINEVIRSNQVDETDANLRWIGLRGRGRIKTKIPGKTYYWFDLARVTGKQLDYDFASLNATSDIVTGSSRRSIRGWGYDVGASVELPFTFKPYLTLGYAKGSGDKRRGGRDTRFRQTGLHNNNGKFRGLTRFRYYGEVLRPDLSNMSVSTLAFGTPIKGNRWIEAIWHRYRQPVAEDRISGSRLDMSPNGISRKIGEEFDIILSHRPSANWDFEFTGGGFRAGDAFGTEQGRWAWLAELKVDFNF